MSSRKHVWLDVVLVNLLLIFPWMFLGSAKGGFIAWGPVLVGTHSFFLKSGEDLG